MRYLPDLDNVWHSFIHTWYKMLPLLMLWHVHGRHSYNSARQHPLYCCSLPRQGVLTNSRALRSIQSSVHSGFGGGGGGGAFACNIDQPQGMVCGGVGTSSASSERVGVSTAAHVGHEGGGSGGRNAGNGGGGGGGIPNCAIGDSALTPTESMDSSQHRMHHLLQSKQDSAQTSRSNSGAHWGPGPSIGIDDLRLVFGAPWASTCMSPTQHNSSVAGFT